LTQPLVFSQVTDQTQRSESSIQYFNLTWYKHRCS